ncbi:hypothetical protein LCGC14_0110760 [marine sediment metagenome]|uniref:Malate synthase N-terminal domain-containing protein n=1 Tax=marine sediment metagenome TaxID=412755 RepID=A0A0F9VAK8_9ZZZZ
MTERVQVGSLQVAKVLHDFINQQAIPGTGLEVDAFWSGLERLFTDLTPLNQALLAKRDDFQTQIDAWHHKHAGQAHDAAAYKAFLQEIGYLLPEPDDFQATYFLGLILAGQEEVLALAELLISDMDRVEGGIVTEIRLFRLKHADAVRLAPLLRAVFAEGPGTTGAEGLQTQVTRLKMYLDKTRVKEI